MDMGYSIFKSVLGILNFSFTEFYLCDVVRKSLGYVPIFWALIDEYYAVSTKVNSGDQQLWMKIVSNPSVYVIAVDLIITFLAVHVFTALSILLAFSIAFMAWMKFGRVRIESSGYLSAILPGFGKGIKQHRKLRLLIIMLCTLLSALCLAIKFESFNIAVAAVISFYILYAFVGEKEFNILLGIVTFNWPILLLSIRVKYPIAASSKSK